MSIFDEVNQDAKTVAPEQAATGPRVGFLQNFEDSYAAQTKASAQFGIEAAMRSADTDQVNAMRKAGIEDVPRLDDAMHTLFAQGGYDATYLNTAKFYEDGGDPQTADNLKAYDDKINILKQKYPALNLQSSGDMWNGVKTQAQQAERATEVSRPTIGGYIGGFAGGAIGGINPNTDPLNAVTLGIGGVGKSVLARIATQGLGQGFIEGVNQITGVQEERRLLGLSHGFGDGLTRVATAAIGGAAVQGAGELVGAGVRRFFRDVPHDPAPPVPEAGAAALPDASKVPPGAIPADDRLGAAKLVSEPASYMDYLQEVSPWSQSRVGKARTVMDLDYTSKNLNNWQGDLPYEMRPLTLADTSARVGDDVRTQPNIFDQVAAQSSIDAGARRVDPDTFRIYDKLADDKAAYLSRIDEMRQGREFNTGAEDDIKINNLNDQIDVLKEKVNRSGAMKSKKLGKQIADLEAQRETIKAATVATTDHPEMSRMRMLAMRNDEKMRDLAPVVSRAYARAQNKWDNTAADREAIRQMIRNGSKELSPVEPTVEQKFQVNIPQTLEDKAPILRARDSVKGKIPQNADAAVVATHVIAARQKVQDAGLDSFRASIAKVLKTDGEDVPKDISIPGQDYKLNLDSDTIVDEDGKNYTIRQFLQKHVETEEDLKAVTSCSIL